MDTVSAFGAQAYAQLRPATRPEVRPENSSDTAAAAVTSFAETLAAAEETARAAMLGKGDTPDLVSALALSELAIETAATLRDKVVEAYQEILRMPV